MYPQEKILGNTFVINVKIGIEYLIVKKLEDTIDYEKVLQIIQARFLKATPLLEELINLIEQDVHIAFPTMKSFFLSICKLNPPLGAEVASSEVSIELKY